MNRRANVVHKLRESALWVGAVLGVLCLLLAALAWLFDIRPLVFRSGSMAPAIEAGALAVSREVPATEVAEGDVVSVVNAAGERVTHRVVSVDDSSERVALQLKGDANSMPDQETYRVYEVHRVIGDVPWAGYVVNAASTPWGLLVCGGFVTYLLVSAFGGRGSGGSRGGHSPAGGPGPREGRRRAERGRSRTTRSMAIVAAAGVIAAGAGPIGTMAAFSDTSRVNGGALVPLTVPPPTSPACASGLNATVSWASAGPNYSYFVTATRVSDGFVAYSGYQTGTSITFTTGLLGNLLSSNFVARIRAVPTGANQWQSSGSITSNFRSRTLGLGTTCGHV